MEYNPGYGTPYAPGYGYGCGCGSQQPMYQGGSYGGYRRGGTFALVFVLFILLVIIGATHY